MGNEDGNGHNDRRHHPLQFCRHLLVKHRIKNRLASTLNRSKKDVQSQLFFLLFLFQYVLFYFLHFSRDRSKIQRDSPCPCPPPSPPQHPLYKPSIECKQFTSGVTVKTGSRSISAELIASIPCWDIQDSFALYSLVSERSEPGGHHERERGERQFTASTSNEIS
jgi:hypothetical protein